MSSSKFNLNAYKNNVYSQYGEDGIIGELIRQRFNGELFSCVEFGAADGFFCSNTAKLWNDERWSATLIESDLELYEKLMKCKSERVETINAKVDNIDNFIDEPVGVMSIDVDGNDYHILEKMQVPHRVLIVEHNPTVPPHVRMIGEYNEQTGSSALSICELAKKKGYQLVAATTCNVIFVHSSAVSPSNKIVNWESNLEVLFDRSCLNYIVTDYLGNYQEIGRFPYGKNNPKNLKLEEEL